MPLREDLLLPISEEAPAGADLSYDKVFDQIKEARTEEDDTLPTGTWSRTHKKADTALVIRLAGDALATRSKDLRLAAWYGEFLLRSEGFDQLAPVLNLLLRLQQDFWDGLYPLREDDGDLGRRIGALESAAAQIATQVRSLPLTRSGVNFTQARDARALSYEQDATTPAKRELREDAARQGRVMPEELDKAIADTPKAFYAETDRSLRGALDAVAALDQFHEEQYGDDPPSLLRLKTALSEVEQFVAGVLAEKRKLDPDPEPVVEESVPEIAEAADIPGAESSARGEAATDSASSATLEYGAELAATAGETAGAPQALPGAEPDSKAGAFAQVAAAVRFFSGKHPAPEIAYLLAAAPGLALLLRGTQDQSWPPPAAGLRQSLRKLARDKNWPALERTALAALAAQPETVWLDLHRFTWQAAAQLRHEALAAAVVATVRGWLQQRPGLERIVLDDDTPTASPETLDWLASLRPENTETANASATQLSAALAAKLVQSNGNGSHASGAEADPTNEALALLKQGRPADAIGLLSRFAEQQPSGRLRFERRLQIAELCLQAGHPAVAQPLLADLMAELERRTLEGWESAGLLGKPLALMIRCLDQGVSGSDNRATLFSRLCRLDPMAAASLDRKDAGGKG